MAITFLERRKRQGYLIFVFFSVLFATGILFWYFFSSREAPPVSVPGPEIKIIEVDWETLKNPQLKQLEIFEETPFPEKEEIGRENPFAPY
jgi:Na+/melibiose symporter-like transporter